MQDEIKNRRKILIRYAAVTIFCLIVSVVYDHFSHGIHSLWMRWLALWPLVLGTFPAFLQAREVFFFGKKQTGSREGARDPDPECNAENAYTVKDSAAEILKDIYRFGVAAVTAASFLMGVLEIAGTDSLYPDVLFYAGIVMLVCGAAGFVFLRVRK